MPNTRSFCDLEDNEHALVPPIVEVRDHLGTLAVQVLAAKEDLSTMDYREMLHKLYDITCHVIYIKLMIASELISFN